MEREKKRGKNEGLTSPVIFPADADLGETGGDQGGSLHELYDHSQEEGKRKRPGAIQRFLSGKHLEN